MTGWIGDERAQLAADKILDAAAISPIPTPPTPRSTNRPAAAAGCSRATLYRYFEDRHALHVAFVHREARRIGGLVAAETDDLAAAVLAAVRLVRESPCLLYTSDAADE